MDAAEQVQRCADFIQKHYHAQLLERHRQGHRHLPISFKVLAEHEPELADLLLDKPEDVIKAAEMAIKDLEPEAKGFLIRITDLPKSSNILIRNVRSTSLGKLLLFDGVVRQKSDVRPQVTSARFECPQCNNTLVMLQLDSTFREPQKCSCGRKGKFRLLSKELVDAQGIVLEEAPDQLDGGEQQKRMNVLLQKDLVSPLSDKKTNPGARIQIVGVVKEVPIILRSGGQSTKFDLMIEANNVITVDETFNELIISPEEEQKIIELSQSPNLHTKIAESIAPSIYGHERVKEAMALQLVSGVRKMRPDGVVTRGDMHILLIGDPGAAKSQMLRRVMVVAPRARLVTGKGASGAGLSASVVKDEFLQGWSLEAGAMVLASGGICCIDEMDKMSKDDTSAMHEALEQQTVTISKANIQATLRCETTVLAAANPKFGRFDPYEAIGKQIDLPPALISRFDLIFPIKDIPETRKDERMANFILELHKNNVQEPPVDTILLRKYFAYARQRIHPTLTDGAVEELRDYFVKIRSSAAGEGNRSIPITARQLEGLVRLSEANARLRLSKKVTRKDAQRAIDILDYCLRQVAYDEKTGTIDIDRISSGTSASERNKILTVKEIIMELEATYNKAIPLEKVLEAAKERGLTESEFEEIIAKLKRGGDIFEPRHGIIGRL